MTSQPKGPEAAPRWISAPPSGDAPARIPLGKRLLAQWRIKLFATPLLMTTFFIAYFLVLKTPLFPVTVMPLIALDELVPFSAAALPVYLSLWPYVLLASALIASRREMLAYGRAVIGVATVGLGIFWVLPTAVPVAEIDWVNYPSFQFLKTVDATGNACPSLHVAFALFTAMWLHRLLRQMEMNGAARALNWIWSGAIIYSTMATRQHVALDVLAGMVLGAAGAALGLRRAGSGVGVVDDASPVRATVASEPARPVL